MNLSLIWDEAFKAHHVVVATPGGEVTLTSKEALDLLTWLNEQHTLLFHSEHEKQEHRTWLETE